MRIRKTSETRPLTGSVVNEYNTSDKNAYSCDYINDRNTYSTTEQVIGTWINTKPIYRKVFHLTTLNQSDSIDISSLNVDYPIKINSIWNKDNKNTIDFNNYYNNSSDYMRIFYRKSNDTLELRNSTGSNTIEVYIIFEYTKTTD